MNEPNEVWSHLSERGRRDRVFLPGKLENHTSDRKGKEKKKREEEGEEDTKAMFALLLATLNILFGRGKKMFDGRGLFDGIVFKTAANVILTRI